MVLSSHLAQNLLWESLSQSFDVAAKSNPRQAPLCRFQPEMTTDRSLLMGALEDSGYQSEYVPPPLLHSISTNGSKQVWPYRSNNLGARYKVIPTEYQLISVTGNTVREKKRRRTAPIS